MKIEAQEALGELEFFCEINWWNISFHFYLFYYILSFFKGKLSHEDLDERALDALKEYNPDDAIQVLRQFCESNLEHVGNKSAFLCGQMKTFRAKSKAGAAAQQPKGPDEAKLKVSGIMMFK